MTSIVMSQNVTMDRNVTELWQWIVMSQNVARIVMSQNVARIGMSQNVARIGM